MSKVTVYTTQQCPYCVAAKSLLKQRGVRYEEIVLSEDDDALWSALYRRSGMKTVPQIFFGDLLVGGYAELSRQDQRDHLRMLGGKP